MNSYVKKILTLLDTAYPDAKTHLEFSTPLEILYDTQGTPSLLYINADGTLNKQVMGIDDYIDSFLKD